MTPSPGHRCANPTRRRTAFPLDPCRAIVSLLVYATVATSAHAQATAFVGARIVPVSGAEIARGVLVVSEGKIVAVGAEGQVAIPAGANRVDVAGKVVMPGLVDTHSHVGDVEGGDSSGPIQPDVRALDSINVRDSRIQKAQAGGVTTVNVMPGSGLLSSGQTVYMKLRDASTVDELLVSNEKGMTGGLKMANGTNPRRSNPPFPGTRAKAAALVREQWVKAQEYRRKVEDGKKDPKKAPTRDLALEALVEALEGKRIVHHHTHRHDDILTALRLQKEFGFRVVLHHVSEGWKVAKEIAAAGVPSSVIVIDSPGGKLEAQDMSFGTCAALDRAGAKFAIHTDDGIIDSRFLLRSAALAVRAGLPRDKALAALTLEGARMLDLGARVGSLEAGKDADFLVLSGDPLSIYSHVEQTWVDGRKVFDRADPKDHVYAVGGVGASHDQGHHVHGIDEFDGHQEEDGE
jgi:imidazolonepropionase-like amidohydrolase